MHFKENRAFIISYFLKERLKGKESNKFSSPFGMRENLFIYIRVCPNKCTKAIQWRKDSPFNKWY